MCFFFVLAFISLQKRQNKDVYNASTNRIMIMTLLLSNITEKHNYPRRGYKRNKYISYITSLVI